MIRVSDNPELQRLVGRTIITTDGTTLLGADDKAGVAVIMETVAILLAHREIPHGPLRICFTCDEEIGHGVDHVDLKKLGARSATRSTATAPARSTPKPSPPTWPSWMRGVNIHPSIAKDRMVNAVRLAADFVARLPRAGLSPETTDGREGFLHPYRIEGGVAEVDDSDPAARFRHAPSWPSRPACCAPSPRQSGGVPRLVDRRERDAQYRNMADGLRRSRAPWPLPSRRCARSACEPKLTIVRGGTDGSR